MNHGTISDPGVYISELFKSFVNKGGKFLKAEVKDILFDNFRNPIYLNTNNGDKDKGRCIRSRDCSAPT